MTEDLLQQVRALAPWHMNIALTPALRTIDGNDHSIPLINPGELRPLLEALYPSGMGGKRFLDCACNSGGYSLLASDLGAYSFGFDVRDHWIQQARFLKRHFGKSDDEVRFEVKDLLEVGEHLANERFDICLFKGIFYHLPDPIAGLKIVADLTDEVIIIDTAAANGAEDGFLKLQEEGVDNPMSGVHRLAWLPTGPVVLCQILEWLGFEATCVMYWQQRPPSDPNPGRIRVVGSRDTSLLARLDAPPTTSIARPREGDTLSGTCKLIALTQGVVHLTKLEFHLTADSVDTVIGVAERTWAGWVCMWDTTSVRNGNYVVTSVVSDFAGKTGRSAGVPVTVRN
jgi:tRNA (mo5U34)-methyltransferase